jgi:hypothetical protein
LEKVKVYNLPPSWKEEVEIMASGRLTEIKIRKGVTGMAEVSVPQFDSDAGRPNQS